MIPDDSLGWANSANAMTERAMRASSFHRSSAARKKRSFSKPPKMIGCSARAQHSSSIAHDTAISVDLVSR